MGRKQRLFRGGFALKAVMPAAAGGVALGAVALPWGGGERVAVAEAAAVQQGGGQADGEERYRVDTVHSMVVFKVKHAGVAYNYGRFNEIQGTFHIDVENPGDSFIDAAVRAESIDTGNESRDNHLRSADFFNAGEYPVIAFEADEFERRGSDTLMAKGTLSLLGRTEPIEVEVEKTGEGDVGRGYKQGFHATFTIERSEYGMTKYLDGSVGDEVTLMVSFEGNRQ